MRVTVPRVLCASAGDENDYYRVVPVRERQWDRLDDRNPNDPTRDRFGIFYHSNPSRLGVHRTDGRARVSAGFHVTRCNPFARPLAKRFASVSDAYLHAS